MNHEDISNFSERLDRIPTSTYKSPQAEGSGEPNPDSNDRKIASEEPKLPSSSEFDPDWERDILR